MSGALPPEGRIAGIDYGHVRIGVAICDPQRTLASPLKNYTRSGESADSNFFRRLVADEDVVGFVVGLPLHMSGDESQKSGEARKFGQWLADQTGCPVVFQDERLTTAAANVILDDAALTRKQRRKRRDMLAAQIILSTFLERSSDFPEFGGHFSE